MVLEATAAIVLCDVTGGKEKMSNPERHSREKRAVWFLNSHLNLHELNSVLDMFC